MRWEYINIKKAENMLMSGWKLYIYGNTVQQGRDLSYILGNFIMDMDLTAKICTNSIVLRNELSKRAWSAMVIYLDPHAVKYFGDYIRIMHNELKINNYPYRGEIPGALNICEDLIHLRYDLEIPVNPVIGVDYDTYIQHYRGEYGEYNIPGNQTLIL